MELELQRVMRASLLKMIDMAESTLAGLLDVLKASLPERVCKYHLQGPVAFFAFLEFICLLF